MTHHAHTGIYSIAQGTYDELVDQAKQGLSPILRDSPGFVSYALTDVGGGRFVSLSAWETREQAEAGQAKSVDWINHHLAVSVVLQEKLIGEMTTLERQPVQKRAADLVAELGRRGAQALRRPKQPEPASYGPLGASTTYSAEEPQASVAGEAPALGEPPLGPPAG